MTEEETEKAVLRYLSSANEDEYGSFRSLTTLFEKIVGPHVPHADSFEVDDEIVLKNDLRAVLDQMVADGLLRSQWGERDYEASYRLTDHGMYEASGFGLLATRPDVVTTESGEPIFTEEGDFVVVEDRPAVGGSAVDSTKWTGQRLVLVDEAAIRTLRYEAAKLRDHVHSMRFESNADSQDLKSLCDGLVAICDMATPDLSIIEQILAHPKFRMTAALVAAIANIRGALGI